MGLGRVCLYEWVFGGSRHRPERHEWRVYWVNMYRRRRALGVDWALTGRVMVMRQAEVKGDAWSQAAGVVGKRGNDGVQKRNSNKPFTVDAASWSKRLPH